MKRTQALFLALLVMLLPLIVGSILLATRHQTTLNALTPFWSDELYYWHQAQTFGAAGFEGGYYSVSETPARFAFSRFYTWGVFTPMVYGVIARFSQWSLNGITLANVGFITVSIGVALALTRPSRRDTLLMGLVMATFLPLILLLPTSMQDVMHMAIAVVLGGCFARLLKGQPLNRWAVGAFILGAVLLRPTWGILLYPLLWLGRAPSLRRMVLEGLGVTVLFGAVAWFFQGTGAPYPHFRTQFFAELASPLEAIGGLWDYFWYNAGLLLSEGHWAARFQRVQIVVLLVGIIGVWGVQHWRKQRPLHTQDALFHLWHLMAVYGATMTLHEVIDGRDYRVLASHLLLSLVVFVLHARPRFALIAIISVCVTAGAWLTQYDEWTAPSTNAVSYSEWQMLKGTLAELAPYQPNENGWCNTVSHSLLYVVDYAGAPQVILAFDGGLGLSWINPENPPQAFKAGYLLLTDGDYDQWRTRLNTSRLLLVPQGALYKNLNSRCF